jgi:hypothetical protein
LAEGYLLDNRGIDNNVAFLGMTYDEYSMLEQVPSPDSLLKLVIDSNPLTELYNCGNRYVFKNDTADMNQLIRDGGLERCRCLVGEGD